MGFIMDGLDAEAYDREYQDRQLLKRIVGYFRPHLKVMGLVALLIVLNALMDAAFPVLIARSLDQLEGVGGPRQVDLGAHGLVDRRHLPVRVALLDLQFLPPQVHGAHGRRRGVEAAPGRLRRRVGPRHVLLRRVRHGQDRQPGDLRYAGLFQRGDPDPELMSQVLIVIIVVALLVFINLRLALIALAIAPVVVLIALAFRRIARHTSTQARRVLAEVNANVQESITGIGVAKSFRQEQRIYEEFKPVNAQSYQLSLRQGLTFSSIFPVLGAVSGIGTALVVYSGGMSVIGGVVTAGALYLFVESINLFWFPLTSIASFWSQFQLGWRPASGSSP